MLFMDDFAHLCRAGLDEDNLARLKGKGLDWMRCWGGLGYLHGVYEECLWGAGSMALASVRSLYPTTDAPWLQRFI